MVDDFNMLNGFREANDIEWELVKIGNSFMYIVKVPF